MSDFEAVPSRRLRPPTKGDEFTWAGGSGRLYRASLGEQDVPIQHVPVLLAADWTLVQDVAEEDG